MSKCFLPDLFDFSSGDWDSYYDDVYTIFYNDFVISSPIFNNKSVYIKKKPMVGNKEQCFFHITNYEDYTINDRVPDFRRCERIKWVKKFIINYFCDQHYDCSGIHNWVQPFMNKNRIYIFSETNRFLVVLEERDKYYLLITAFYISQKNEKKIVELNNNYNKYEFTEIKK